ncbi:MAG: signal peptidase I [Candidatus Marinimicrobia bacterium]|nr:signal peptidase I [Candidatus Neomarinimicrobiota bacterium]
MTKEIKKPFLKPSVKQEIKSWVLIILIALGIKQTIVASYHVPTGSMENTIMTGDFLFGNNFIYGSRTPDWIGIPYTRMGFHIPWFRLPSIKEPEQGDIVIFKYPEDQYVHYVKRCIAAPGQTIEVINKEVFIDGKRYPDPKHSKYVRPTTYSEYWKDYNIFPRGAGNQDNYGPIYVPKEGDTLRIGKYPTQLFKNVVELAHHSFYVQDGKIVIDEIEQDYYIVEQDYYFMMGDNRDNSLDSRFWGFVPFDLVVGRAMVVWLSVNKEMPLYRFTKIVRWNRFGKIIS